MLMKACKKELHLAFPQGPCFGVKRSIQLCHRILEKQGSAFAIHPLVHNEIVMTDLMKHGLVLEENIEEIPSGSWVVLSAHGTPKDVLERLKEKKCNVVDAVCPLVLYVHKKALEAVRDFGKVNIVGDPRHQEIKALLSELPEGSYVLCGEEGQNADKRFPVVFQSTTDPIILQKLVEEGYRTIDTICAATKGRQLANAQLIEKCDAVVILGSSTSANSRHLAAKASAAGKPALLTLDLNEAASFSLQYDIVGIIAGASTPLELVYQAYDRIITAYEKVCNHRSP